jgi:hypothetical protein
MGNVQKNGRGWKKLMAMDNVQKNNEMFKHINVKINKIENNRQILCYTNIVDFRHKSGSLFDITYESDRFASTYILYYVHHLLSNDAVNNGRC